MKCLVCLTMLRQIGKIAALSAVPHHGCSLGMLSSYSFANVASVDNRLSTISLLFLPAIGWVAFNILQPAFNQLNRMNEMKEVLLLDLSARRSVALLVLRAWAQPSACWQLKH